MTSQKPLCLALLIGLFGCGASVVPTIETTTFAPALQVQLSNSTKLASGVYYRDLVVHGTGAAIAANQTITTHYTGWLADGTQFDTNVNVGKQPFQFVLGTGFVIPGWDVGLVGAQVGGTRQLIIPPAMGYGASGAPPAIPPNAILVFNVQIDSSP